MDLSDFLAARAGEIVNEAVAAMAARKLEHYERLGGEATAARIRALFDHVVDGARTRDLIAILGYAEQIGKQRYRSGFEFVEVQSAFNLLEEAIWRAMLASYPQPELGLALGVVATVLGAAKDRLASTYLSLATETHVPSLELGSLFRGTQNTGGGAGQV
jgi:urease accessory protein UreF